MTTSRMGITGWFLRPKLTITLGLMLLATSISPSALAVKRPLVAVLDFSGSKAKLSADELQELTEIARKVGLEKLRSHYEIITRESTIDLLKGAGKTLEQCQGECETETGRLLGAEIVVNGIVRRAFGGYSLVLKAHSTEPPKLLAMHKERTKKRSALPGLVKTTSQRLFSDLAPQLASANTLGAAMSSSQVQDAWRTSRRERRAQRRLTPNQVWAWSVFVPGSAHWLDSRGSNLVGGGWFLAGIALAAVIYQPLTVRGNVPGGGGAAIPAWLGVGIVAGFQARMSGIGGPMFSGHAAVDTRFPTALTFSF